MVNLIFVGTGGWITRPHRNYQCIFIEKSDNVLVLECGAFTSEQFSIYKDYLNKIKTIVITHVHGDHVSGLPSLLFFMKYSGVDNQITILTPSDYIDFIEQISRRYVEGAAYELSIVKLDNKKFDLGDFQLSFYEVEHSMYNVGCKIRIDDKVIGYSSDTRLCPGLEKISDGSDILICEASFPSDMREKAYEVGHLTPLDAVYVAKKYNVKQLILSHIGFDVSMEKTNYNYSPILWASDNMVLSI